jgi:prepilin-type N-terminal cleavage/methylation domain-containing protein
MRTSGASAGFTLVELMVVVVILVPILAVITSTTRVVTRDLDTNDRDADVSEVVRRSLLSITQFVRPGKLSTFRVLSTLEDVNLGNATSVGEWIMPTDLAGRPGLKFQAAEGLLRMNAALSTSPRELKFALDPRELPNGVDDDGDGLNDEGTITLVYDGMSMPLAHEIEQCRFTTAGRFLRISLRAARRDAQGRVHRFTGERTIYVRNN